MKKFLFLFLLLIPFNVFAYTYTVNDEEHTVTDAQTMRDACYFNLYKGNNYDKLFIFAGYNSSDPVCVVTSNSCVWDYNSLYCDSGTYNILECFDSFGSCSTRQVTGFGGWNNVVREFLYSNVDIYNFNDDVVFQSNFTIQSIEESYAPEPDPDPEQPSSDNTIFYVLAIILFIFFWVWYLRVCFPMKGGKNL